MKIIFLLIALALLTISTATALDPIKVAIVNNGGGAVNVQVNLTNYTGGTATNVFTSAPQSLTPNGSGIIMVDISDATYDSGTLWSAIAPSDVNSYYVIDVNVGGNLYAQYRLDQQILGQAQGGVLDNSGNFTPATNGDGSVGSDDLRWGELFVEGNTIHVGPAGGTTGNTELALSYNAGTASLNVDNVSVIDATKVVVTFNKPVSQEIGDDNTAFGTDALDGNTKQQVSAFGKNSAQGNTGDDVTAIGYNAGNGNTKNQLTAVGHASAKDNTGTQVTAIGVDAGRGNSGNDVTAIGYNSGNANNENELTAVGHASAKDNMGEQVTVIGVDAGRGNSGNDLTASGYNAGRSNSGSDVTAAGNAAARDNGGNNVTAMGVNAGRSNTGSDVVAIGVSAGQGNSRSNAIIIGNSVNATADNQVVIGNGAITETQLRGVKLMDKTGAGTRNIAVNNLGEVVVSESTVNTNTTISGDGSTGSPLGINLANANTWTGQQTFNSNTSVSGTNTFTVGTGATSLGGTLAVTDEAVIDGLSIGQGGGNITSNTAVGVNALSSNTTGSVNTAIGDLALSSNVDGANNTATGRASLQANTSGNNNTATGRASLYLNETGSNNTANGGEALRNNLSGNNNTAIGVHALFLNTIGNFNSANGNAALYSNTEGDFNTATGRASLFKNSTGNSNTATGNEALRNNETGNYNTANGVSALFANTTGNYNTANGYHALDKNISGSNNTASGYNAGNSLTTGSENIFIGRESGSVMTLQKVDAVNTIAIGYLAYTGGDNSIAIGANTYTTADNQVVIGDANITETNLQGVLNVPMHAVIDGITVGQGAGDEATNMVIGSNALSSNTTGNRNTATGTRALRDNSTTSNNTATGFQALMNSTGNGNTAQGSNALLGNLAGSQNTASGYSSLSQNTTGSGNSAFGNFAGQYLTTGSNNVFVGSNSGNSAFQKVDAANSIAIGANTYTTADNQVVIGDANITETQLRGVKLMDMTGSGNQNLIVDNNGNIVAGGGTVATNSSLIGDGSGTPLGINLANNNIWTGVQTFNGATTNLGGSLVLSGSSNISNSSSPDLFVNDNLRLTNNNDLVMSGSDAVLVNYTDDIRVGDDFAVGASGGGSDVFNVALASGNTTVGGDVTISNLAGGGNQNLHVDNNGKLVAGDGSGGFIVSISNNLGTLSTTYEDTGIQFLVDANSTYLIKGFFQVDDQLTNGTVDGRLFPVSGASFTFADFRTFGYELFFTLPIEFTNLEADDDGVNPDRIDGIFRTGNAGLIKFQIRKSPTSPDDVDFDSGGQVTLIKLL